MNRFFDFSECNNCRHHSLYWSLDWLNWSILRLTICLLNEYPFAMGPDGCNYCHICDPDSEVTIDDQINANNSCKSLIKVNGFSDTNGHKVTKSSLNVSYSSALIERAFPALEWLTCDVLNELFFALLSIHWQLKSNGYLNGGPKRPVSDYISKKEEAPLYVELLCYLSYIILILFGYLRDFLRAIGLEKTRSATEKNREVWSLITQMF